MQGWFRLLAYLVPVGILLFVLYLNYLPFGYDRTFVIRAGVAGDRDGEFRLLQARDGFSERLVTAEGMPYRELSGASFAIFTPKAYLRDALAVADIDADGIMMLAPNIDLDPDAFVWDYTLPEDAAASGCTYFDGTRDLAIPEADAVVADGPFSLYIEWTPEDDDDGFQRLIGGSGFEILQNKEDVKFELGSTTLKQPIDNGEFFGKRHAALAVFVPATLEEPDGHIDLYVDGGFSGRVYFQAGAATDPASGGIAIGKSPAPEATYFRGCVHDLRMRAGGIDMAGTHIEFAVTRKKNDYPITLINVGGGTAILRSLTLHVVQD